MNVRNFTIQYINEKIAEYGKLNGGLEESEDLLGEIVHVMDIELQFDIDNYVDEDLSNWRVLSIVETVDRAFRIIEQRKNMWADAEEDI